MKTKLKLLLAAGLLAAFSTSAIAAGIYTNGLPTAGGSQYPSTLPLTGNELIPADTQLPQGLNPATEAVSVNQLNQGSFNTATNATSFSALNTQVAGGGKITLLLTGAISTATTLTLPTAVSMIAAMPYGTTTGYSYLLKFVNAGGLSTSWTISGNTGITLSGATNVPLSGSRAYLVSLPTSSTLLLRDIGNGF